MAHLVPYYMNGRDLVSLTPNEIDKILDDLSESDATPDEIVEMFEHIQTQTKPFEAASTPITVLPSVYMTSAPIAVASASHPQLTPIPSSARLPAYTVPLTPQFASCPYPESGLVDPSSVPSSPAVGYDQSPVQSRPASPPPASSGPSRRRIMVCSYPALHDKSAVASWVVLFIIGRPLSLHGFRLRLARLDKRGRLVMIVDDFRDLHDTLSWKHLGTDPVTGEKVWQVKLAFRSNAEKQTYDNECFAGILEHSDLPGQQFLLGAMRVISNTTQRKKLWRQLAPLFPDASHRQILTNCEHHPPRSRHFRNGKGSNQGAREPEFRLNEYEKAVPLTPLPSPIPCKQYP